MSRGVCVRGRGVFRGGVYPGMCECVQGCVCPGSGMFRGRVCV